jgi:hypothetical protein
MPLLLAFVRPIDERGENLDELMDAAKAEGHRFQWHARGGTPEFVGDDGAARRDGSCHRLNQKVDAAAVECGKPAGLHECALPIDNKGVELRQRGTIWHRIHGAREQRPELEKGAIPAWSATGTEGELRPSGSYGRSRFDFCRGSQARSTRSVDPGCVKTCWSE